MVGFQDSYQLVQRGLSAFTLGTQHHGGTVFCAQTHEREDARRIQRLVCWLAFQGYGDLYRKFCCGFGEDCCRAGVQADSAADNCLTFCQGGSFGI